jgi:nucleoid-associated protein YgaU
MSEDQGDLEQQSGGASEGGAGGESQAGGGAAGGSEGGSSRADWQKELAERLKAQRERRAQAQSSQEEEEPAEETPPPTRDAGTPEWETAVASDDELAVTDPTRSDLAGLEAAQQTWAGYVGQAESAVNAAATWFGESAAAITSFLAPVPAMLLVFLTPKVPIPIPIPVMYKPTSLSWSKKADWSNPIGGHHGADCSGKEQKTPFRNVPQATFKGGGPELLDLELFFDTTDTQLDVRLMIKPIQALVYMVPLRNEPPLVMFSWGMILSKMSFVEDLDIEYTMFRADGTPLRAEVSMTLTEYDMGWLSNIPMNPTSYSEARKTWVVTEGQTLDWIAYQEYGNAVHWRHIAQTNNLANPRDLRPGQILKLTPLP